MTRRPQAPEAQGTDELLALAFQRIHECDAANNALMFVVLALIEQIPHDKARLLESLTRIYDSLNTVMDRDGGPNEQIQEVVRGRLDLMTKLFCEEN